MAGSMLSDLVGPEPNDDDLPFTALARQYGVWIPPDLNSSELPFAALARSFGVTPLTAGVSDPADQSYATPIADERVSGSEDTPSDILRYPDGTPVTDPDPDEKGDFHPYPRPPKMDVAANLELGRQIAPLADLVPWPELMSHRDAFMAGWFRAGGPMDYKRPDGLIAALFGAKNYKYRGVTYYNYGGVAAAAGYTEDEAVNAARAYNRLAGSQAPNLTPDAEKNIRKGWADADQGKWAQ